MRRDSYILGVASQLRHIVDLVEDCRVTGADSGASNTSRRPSHYMCGG